MALLNQAVTEVRFRCIDLAITAVRDRVGRKDSTSPTDAEVLETAKKFEQYVLAADGAKTHGQS